MKDPLAAVLLPGDTPDAATFRVATVTTDNTPGPVDVTLAGGTALSAAFLSSYTPVVNDTVLVLQTKTDLIILGAIISGG